jgi:TRAP-type C4-dicarboxylate transport system permease small subunit
LFGIVIGVLILLMTADIALRYFRLGSLPWLIELSEYLFCGGSLLAAPWVLRQGGHIRVDILLTSVPSRVAQRLEQIVDLLGLIASGVLFYYGSIALLQAWRAQATVFKTWWTPEWIVLAPLPIACLLLAIEFILRFFRVGGAAPVPIDPAHRPSL